MNEVVRESRRCLNCDTELLDMYCHHCGQKNLPQRQTLRELIENFIGSFFSFESKFFKTVRFLLFKPGFLPLEYTSGKRESYFHPARAYVFISFIFFTLLFALPDFDEKKQNTELDNAEVTTEVNDLNKGDSISRGSVKVDSIIQFDLNGKIKGKKIRSSGFSLTDSPYTSIKEYDSAQRLLPENKRDGWIERAFEVKNIELKNYYSTEDGKKRFKKDFVGAFFSNVPRVVFFLLPIFALILKLLYVRRDFYYSEHLVFSINYYNFFFLGATAILLVNQIPVINDWLVAICVIWIIIYLPIAMKRFYKQSKRKTIFKFLLLFFTFNVCLVFGVVASLLLILFNL